MWPSICQFWWHQYGPVAAYTLISVMEKVKLVKIIYVKHNLQVFQWFCTFFKDSSILLLII